MPIGRGRRFRPFLNFAASTVTVLSGLHGNSLQARTQSVPRDTRELSGAIARVKSGNFGGADVEMIARARDVDAIRPLEDQFARADDENIRAKIASTLVRLGDRDNRYWDYLTTLAAPAAQSDAPGFMTYDSQGKATPGPSPKLLEWAKAHDVSAEEAMKNALYRYPGAIGHLAMTGDPRAIPLLRKALASPNYRIQILAAEGLAKANDTQSIRLIIDTCQKAPAEVATVIAGHSLIYFDNDDAQSAAAKYIPNSALRALRQEGHIPGTDPFR